MKYKVIDKKSISKKGSGYINKILKPLGPIHIPGYNYCGPNSKLGPDGPEPVNRVDKICFEHDVAYEKAGEDQKKILEADCEMIEKLEKLTDLSTHEYIGYFLGKNLIKLKNFLGSGIRSKKYKKLKKPRKNKTKKK